MITTVRRVLFMRTDRLGETLLNLPALAALKTALPHASLTLLVHPDLQPLMALTPGVDRVLVYRQSSGRWWWTRALRLSKLLRADRFDVAIVSNPKKELHVAVWLARIPWRVGYDRKWGWLLTHRLTDRKTLGGRHEVEYNLDLLTLLGIMVPSVPALALPVSEQEAHTVSHLLERVSVPHLNRLVAVHPWASNPKKQWPIERFRELAQRLRRRPGVAVVLIGGTEERPHAPHVIGTSPDLIDLVGQLSLTQLAAFLRRAKVLVSNDSGPVHLAAAVGTPTVVLFGTADPATGPARWGPWGTGHTVIWKPAMDAIEVDEVFQAVQRCL